MATDQALRDPEIDTRRHDRPGRDAASPPWLPPYQRLVANPFLAAFAVVLWSLAVRGSFQAKRADLFLAALASGLLVPLLFQYHCLDCGATGHVARSALHQCDQVTARLQRGTPRRFRGPTPGTQTKLWLLAFSVAGLFALVFR